MKHLNIQFAFLIMASFLVISCSGSKKTAKKKTAEPAEKPVTVKPAPEGKCVTFASSGDKDKAIKAHVLYRDYMKQDKLTEAFPFWEKAYGMAPAADGNRPFHFTDGIKIYKHFLKTGDPTKKELYKGKILALHDERIKCYQKEGYVLGRKASDMMYYTDSSPDEIYKTTRKSVELQGNKSEYLVLFPYANSMIDLYKAGKKTPAEAREVLAKVQKIADANMRDPEQAKNKEKYKTALEQVEDLYTYTSRSAEGLPALFDCNYYIEKTKRDYPTMPSDLDGLENVLGRLYQNGCDESHPFYNQYFSKLKELRKADLPVIVDKPSSSGGAESPLSKGTRCLKAGDNQCAINHYKEVLDSPNYSQDKKAKIALRIAKIYYGELRDKSSARTYARKAAKLDPSSGEPYFLIGNMYASSGKDCGSGTGFNSQRTVWVAIDQWKRAISVAPGSSAAQKAQQRINEYKQYMPSQEQIFMRSLKKGQTYTVTCWINESTTVRFVK